MISAGSAGPNRDSSVTSPISTSLAGGGVGPMKPVPSVLQVTGVSLAASAYFSKSDVAASSPLILAFNLGLALGSLA